MKRKKERLRIEKPSDIKLAEDMGFTVTGTRAHRWVNDDNLGLRLVTWFTEPFRVE